MCVRIYIIYIVNNKRCAHMRLLTNPKERHNESKSKEKLTVQMPAKFEDELVK